MSPELVFLLRLALVGAALVGLELVWSRRAARLQNRAVRFVQPNPVVRFRASPVRQVTAKRADPGAQPLNPIVRLEPLGPKTDDVTEKRAA